MEESKFLEDLKRTELSLKTDDPNKNYNFITERFLESAEENKGFCQPKEIKNFTIGNSDLPKFSFYDIEKLYEIPPKLIKLSAKVFSKLLTIEINHSFNKEAFPDNTKIGCFSIA